VETIPEKRGVSIAASAIVVPLGVSVIAKFEGEAIKFCEGFPVSASRTL